MQTAPNCYECVSFEITHQPHAPRACRRLGIKCRDLPSLSLFYATGKHCPFFTPKGGGADMDSFQSSSPDSFVRSDPV
ncbi:MAG TPA: uracil-DNA glycosylase [Candidatus Xenobia bacterium]|jgi:hypothetical protein